MSPVLPARALCRHYRTAAEKLNRLNNFPEQDRVAPAKLAVVRDSAFCRASAPAGLRFAGASFGIRHDDQALQKCGGSSGGFVTLAV